MNKKTNDNIITIFLASLLLIVIIVSDYVILDGISLTLNNLESFQDKNLAITLCGILFLLGLLLSSIPFLAVYKYKKEN
ncbi:hypothetical protein [Escherichia coli]|jgi:riboflavin synthase alpha subunit|nr:hypothetical protein [Escherichia coli]EFB1290998.1 hypothetical protein [Escherichia coli]EFB1300638.1 hypothetical protein [Escherichia coli]EFB9456141.1 hypothetical protein [Escherichia coli]EFH4247808.1 hypothetical protein [Escherichia coli]ELM5066860.1 hypothetical protein [Escherichia coli]